ncbi:MAG: DUF4124 domain-containing protein [Betaproteobacteria bacterium]
MALLVVPTAYGSTVFKCSADGRTVFQDTPCEKSGETARQSQQRQARNDALHRKLDQLQASGHGMVQRSAPPPPPAPRPAPESEKFVPMTRAQVRMQQQAAMARHAEESEKRNAESAATLTRLMQETEQACNGKVQNDPQVGMSDAAFRQCTWLGRFGSYAQIVVSEEGGMPLRLYVFASGRVKRVYSIDGVVTAVKP